VKPQLRYQVGQCLAARYLVHKASAGDLTETYLCFDRALFVPRTLITFQAPYWQDAGLADELALAAEPWRVLPEHPNLVRCYGLVQIDGRPMLELEPNPALPQRPTCLRDWLSGPLEPAQALGFAIDVCRALDQLGQAQPGAAHGDLQPANILVDQQGKARLTGFAFANALRAAAPACNAGRSVSRLPWQTTALDATQCLDGRVGTPLYMAPETWQGTAPDLRADFYALGCLLYQMLAGHPPYTQRTLEGLKRQHLRAPVPGLKAAGRPPDLYQVLDACLAKRREDRFPDAAALLAALSGLYERRYGPLRPPATGLELKVGQLHNQGTVSFALGHHAEALRDFAAALQAGSVHPPAAGRLGGARFLLPRYADRLADTADAAVLDPADGEGRYARGIVYYYLGDNPRALTSFAAALERDPACVSAYSAGAATYLRLGQAENAAALCEQALAVAPQDRLALHWLVKARMAARQYGPARDALSRLIELGSDRSPGQAKLYLRRGRMHERLRLEAEAIADYGLAAAIGGDDPQPYLLRGRLYSKARRYRDALRDFAQALRLQAGSAAAYAWRGVTLARLGHYLRALADLTQAAALDPQNARVYYNRGLVHDRLGDQAAVADAVADLERAIDLDSTFARAFAQRGLIEYRAACYDRSLSALTCALALDPGQARLWMQRARTCVRL